MPNAKVLSEKQAIVAALVEDLKAANSGVLVDYKGITVAEDTALRHELRENGVEYAVVKNTLLRFAVADTRQLDTLLASIKQYGDSQTSVELGAYFERKDVPLPK